ncbi:hypothetical protein CLL_A1939 [Clostridium botulinum B str. Eklund 17B (NRP)]|uniref:Uncharacterized protein n=1 Tax=Clostridium botulinum (strain Eklund 17B / Type B) TaxID=935198 RepID=B2TM15_CLOBB|nr:hypothetical protein CLL_A1939 [Clostridium botulinum B str. Eklund 17B (NRP)]MBY6977104.1 hypothetical protein [Clostridium botulinum]MBY6999262.1 hypothetical protein [Clostridium botulinum]MCR1272657.1 hypothetical protein [Clostridium botulinum]CDH90850.1 hypothetical protein CB17B1861 [Clostridium botulinum B str. Eklund 17B (NRP)]
MKFKEFRSDCNFIDVLINKWLKENPSVKVMDVNYTANNFGSHVLVSYEE